MPQPSPPSSPDEQPDPGETEFEQTLAEVAENLQSLRDRYEQIKRDRLRQKELQYRREQIRKSPKQNGNSSSLKAEIKQIQEQLEIIEINLESSLFSWRSLKEPFWQAVRFGGLGIIIGWLLKSYAL
jgi:chromosome segregation ATPase